MMILLTLCTLYVRGKRNKTALSLCFALFLSLFLCFPTSSSPLCSGSCWRMICDSKPKFLLIKRPPPLCQQCVLEQRGKRSVSSRREARRGFWQVSVTAEVGRESVCVFVCVHVCWRLHLSYKHTHTRARVTLEKADSSLTVARARAHTREQMPCSYHQTKSNAPASCRAIASFLFPLAGS